MRLEEDANLTAFFGPDWASKFEVDLLFLESYLEETHSPEVSTVLLALKESKFVSTQNLRIREDVPDLESYDYIGYDSTLVLKFLAKADSLIDSSKISINVN